MWIKVGPGLRGGRVPHQNPATSDTVGVHARKIRQRGPSPNPWTRCVSLPHDKLG